MNEHTQKIKIRHLLPVMFGFFIMGFIDIIGIATNYIKSDLGDISDTMASLLSLSCFFWFLVLSIPAGGLLNRYGRKRTVLVSLFIHAVGLIIPFIHYSFGWVIVSFGLVGIGNTLLQVALNPLVTNVVTKERLTATLTLGQFVKAMSSLSGPVLAAWFAGTIYGWRLLFPVFAAVSLLEALWLLFTRVPKEDRSHFKAISVRSVAGLLKDPYIRVLFIGILVLVGVDVGMNVSFPKYLMADFQLPLEKAGMGNSIYFFSRTVGALIGGILMMRLNERKFYIYSVLLALLGLLIMLMASSLASQRLLVAFVGVVLFGLGYANLFSIVFAFALHHLPLKANEVSALLIIGVSGGAVLPPVIGLATDLTHAQMTGIILIAVVWMYMLYLNRFMARHEQVS